METCLSCNKEAETFWSERRKRYLCSPCMRVYDPPYMTLMKFNLGNYNRLWNLEVGQYEEFSNVEEIEWCGWIVRSRQETVYKLVPKVVAIVYHMEFFGNIVCGRCVGYPCFEVAGACMSVACEKLAKPHRPKAQIEHPPEGSRYVKWTNLQQ